MIAIVGLVFTFAGYNLYSYFVEQKAIQIEEDRQAEVHRLERIEEVKIREEKRQAKIEEDKKIIEAEEQEIKDRAAEKQAEHEAQEKKAEEDDKKREAERKKYEEAQIANKVQNIRTVRNYEGLSPDQTEKLKSLSAAYIRAKPEEFLDVELNCKVLDCGYGATRMLANKSDLLMLYAAISNDIDVIKAFIDIGLDVNSKNERGFTPLMFAAAYGDPKVIRFLIGQGSDIKARAYIKDMNALHIASLWNPNPDVIDVLVQAGISIESETEGDYTSLVIAISENFNLEVARRLAELGANTKAVDDEYKAVLQIAEERIDFKFGRTRYGFISQEFNEQLLNKLQ
ncbi:MAG: ankyrin repeat domain-containing protein [Flavobacteriaceae bacterium]|nr:ankyrin repeat domain-containing protein [Flavobacteriaceae bacterium]